MNLRHGSALISALLFLSVPAFAADNSRDVKTHESSKTKKKDHAKADKKAAKLAKEDDGKDAKDAKETAKPAKHKVTSHRPKGRHASIQKHEEGRHVASKTCFHDPVEIIRGTGEKERVTLTRCDGEANEKAIHELSMLARPLSVPRATGSAKDKLPDGAKSIDGGLMIRLQSIADHYKGKTIAIVSGYRPGSVGSYHHDAKALDLHVEGVKNEDLSTFCRGLRDTGCGFYPNSSFVHVDVRPHGTGHVYWIDASGPGEKPHYVASWPPPKDADDEVVKPDAKAPSDEHTHPDSGVSKAGHGIGTSDRDDGGDQANEPKNEKSDKADEK